ncbi:glucose-1-phosphate adenylyltransferase [Paenibacillus xerothermodurans]|uniref:Glucose-1-phosphate adenylyltransferase n=1 Tax=Paenibacillus xerothermodurans TaxID=1977292 RepID=A0A2W1N657_PAEXE|nr:glucose-1-phosphate adenylyltransferase [Paenibacillus xerothermodurans]PZE20139.1 glucose-1-phosphate adenylyltransferase [Paenibacillus xerothermodurans]
MTKKDCIAMLLAGGEGRRLSPFTKHMAKPAVPFGGQYRIIDFPLSNCANSGIQTVGVLTQYEWESLHRHIGQGEPWGYQAGEQEGVCLLSPESVGTSCYAGTADAIYKNIPFIDQHNPEHVLILSGDHIYSMDYRALLESHKASGADATISVMEVPWAEAHRFGIMNTDSTLRITEFLEKPKKPESNLASMGIYIFKWSYLRQHLIEDSKNPRSSHDFGKDLIPRMLRLDGLLYAYPFDGYWRDVGTVKSLWEAHMDLLRGQAQLNLQPSDWPMYSRSHHTDGLLTTYPRHDVEEILAHRSSSILGSVYRTVLFAGVQIGESSRVQDSVLMPNVTIGRNVRISHAIIGEGAVIEDGAVIEGHEDEIAVVAPHALVPRRSYMDSDADTIYAPQGAQYQWAMSHDYSNH